MWWCPAGGKPRSMTGSWYIQGQISKKYMRGTNSLVALMFELVVASQMVAGFLQITKKFGTWRAARKQSRICWRMVIDRRGMGGLTDSMDLTVVCT